MKALPDEKLPEDDFVYEIKFEGYRVLAFKDGKDVRLISRNKKGVRLPATAGYLEIVGSGTRGPRWRNCGTR